MKLEEASFSSRRARSEFVARRFAPVLRGKVLDVGCYEAPLREILQDCEYCGVDIAGNPDRVLNLDSVDALPFPDGSQDCVLCIEVLEHLENLHHMFHELVRVSRRHVIVSLPNCWRDARQPIDRGRGHFAHYGLPVEKPQDRHRWFFSHTQARDFLLENASRLGLEVVEIFATEQQRPALKRFLRKLRYPGEKYLNRYSQTVWVLLRKPD
ncbi:MAG: class I SAM-dependent methyltransferase [Gammaproteobacteria bacterium]|nr:class I SAM-dependent methyltransferase [Gammaproteobacteria bacterium]MBU1656268.1 class I SAM-dependent methyltransferase [Gammaproteobacteria bacterium]MBU1959833.1 class I SAM-dependent methyltransferase [Gammaproteobacteria bacterium]